MSSSTTPQPLRGRLLPEVVRDRVRGLRRRLPVPLVRQVDRRLGATPVLPTPEELARAAARPEPPRTPVRLWIAPANFAGQGHAWARAVDEHVPGAGARCMAVEGPHGFAADQVVPAAAYRDIAWQKAQERYVLASYTHVLVEAGRPVLGTLYGRTCAGELPRLRQAGGVVGLISHGSDLRVPSRHAERFQHSPFRGSDDPLTARLERNALAQVQLFETFDGPTFVSTPDLLDDAPRATWCPTVVDPDRWASDTPVLERPRPRVVHVPSRGRLKGSAHIDAVLTDLHERGGVDYVRLEGVPHTTVQREVRAADVVIDQAVMGLYGVSALEGLAAGRLVLGFVGDRVRERVRDLTGLDVPIVEITPETLADVLGSTLDDRDTARSRATLGPAFVREVHDGRRSAAVLGAWLATSPLPSEA
ncbi:glycosyltransferase [Ornithinimicrobium pekingense]|uniref:Glycosyltransferase family 1 protein n=1 Tax=Ornithinimicrobium pekingense TaxID=384677 RepID=A0ABQ2F8D5_9MICO|nr:glycosyl transferase family 1 [Ornithinimicrobium pekingense]GGK67710.1 hypothetical protein GCM10011509_15100 [Ornithinimicrobium pekingense]